MKIDIKKKNLAVHELVTLLFMIDALAPGPSGYPDTDERFYFSIFYCTVNNEEDDSKQGEIEWGQNRRRVFAAPKP